MEKFTKDDILSDIHKNNGGKAPKPKELEKELKDPKDDWEPKKTDYQLLISDIKIPADKLAAYQHFFNIVTKALDITDCEYLTVARMNRMINKDEDTMKFYGKAQLPVIKEAMEDVGLSKDDLYWDKWIPKVFKPGKTLHPMELNGHFTAFDDESFADVFRYINHKLKLDGKGDDFSYDFTTDKKIEKSFKGFSEVYPNACQMYKERMYANDVDIGVTNALARSFAQLVNKALKTKINIKDIPLSKFEKKDPDVIKLEKASNALNTDIFGLIGKGIRALAGALKKESIQQNTILLSLKEDSNNEDTSTDNDNTTDTDNNVDNDTSNETVNDNNDTSNTNEDNTVNNSTEQSSDVENNNETNNDDDNVTDNTNSDTTDSNNTETNNTDNEQNSSEENNESDNNQEQSDNSENTNDSNNSDNNDESNNSEKNDENTEQSEESEQSEDQNEKAIEQSLQDPENQKNKELQDLQDSWKSDNQKTLDERDNQVVSFVIDKLKTGKDVVNFLNNMDDSGVSDGFNVVDLFDTISRKLFYASNGEKTDALDEWDTKGGYMFSEYFPAFNSYLSTEYNNRKVDLDDFSQYDLNRKQDPQTIMWNTMPIFQTKEEEDAWKVENHCIIPATKVTKKSAKKESISDVAKQLELFLS